MNRFLKYKISFLDSFIPFSHGNVTFDLLTSGQKYRPGYSDFYNSSVLQEFMKATQIRLHFRGQYYPAGHTGDPRHQYYAVDEITVRGRYLLFVTKVLNALWFFTVSFLLKEGLVVLLKENVVAEILEQARYKLIW